MYRLTENRPKDKIFIGRYPIGPKYLSNRNNLIFSGRIAQRSKR